jgi:beta-mannosidase
VSAHAVEKDGQLEISLKAMRLALFVALETGVSGTFSDNAFDLMPNESRTILFTPDEPAQLGAARAGLIARDLYSSSH